MSMPGFTAEAALYGAGGFYPVEATTDKGDARVVPQAKYCIATHDGGLWCCIRGPWGQPICWKVPPKEPPIIWV
jgi:hypothetical protein